MKICSKSSLLLVDINKHKWTEQIILKSTQIVCMNYLCKYIKTKTS